MKKILFLLLILLSSCSKYKETNIEDIPKNLTYFQDEKTKLCFACINVRVSNSYFSTSITCVPCDSLKNKGLLK